jgi:hypothetical protein
VNVTRLFLVRHGATSATQEDRFSGSSGAELSEEGRWQAARLGERLSHQNITAAYSSPLSRALDTARIIAEQCGLEPATRDGLREMGHGHWEGMKRRDVEEQFAVEYAAWEADPFTFAPEGGESGLGVLARAPCPGRVAQSDVAAGAEQPARLRSARLSGSARSVSGLPERSRFPRSGEGPAHALQRYVTLRRPSAHLGSEPLEVVESGVEATAAEFPKQEVKR